MIHLMQKKNNEKDNFLNELMENDDLKNNDEFMREMANLMNMYKSKKANKNLDGHSVQKEVTKPLIQ